MTDEELPTGPQLKTLLQRMGDTLACRKFSTVVSEQMLLNCTVLLGCKLAVLCNTPEFLLCLSVSAELPVLSPSECSGGDGVVVVAGSGSEPPVRALLEQLAELLLFSSAPLHLLFTPLTVTAVLKASDTEWNNYLFLVRELVDRGALREEEVVSHWKKLTNLALPAELIENFQLRSQSIKPSLPLAQLQSHMEMLQVSQQTVEGAT
ncbi:hypothetical protein F7725_008352 [Dissostichus mawsoni]|uniref:Uncharacterized protein n=1 Tax=Dissostichus mawsoni TaxID=36200 RepID=A0A7J5Y8V6_DISMA|nr:hypothetical protein F7725_008352 [Dissostichus mawsoni]